MAARTARLGRMRKQELDTRWLSPTVPSVGRTTAGTALARVHVQALRQLNSAYDDENGAKRGLWHSNRAFRIDAGIFQKGSNPSLPLQNHLSMGHLQLDAVSAFTTECLVTRGYSRATIWAKKMRCLQMRYKYTLSATGRSTPCFPQWDALIGTGYFGGKDGEADAYDDETRLSAGGQPTLRGGGMMILMLARKDADDRTRCC